MDATTIISAIAGVINAAINMGPEVIKDATPFAEAIYNNLIKGQATTDAELAQLEADIAVLSAQLQAPLPPDTTA